MTTYAYTNATNLIDMLCLTARIAKNIYTATDTSHLSLQNGPFQLAKRPV